MMNFWSVWQSVLLQTKSVVTSVVHRLSLRQTHAPKKSNVILLASHRLRRMNMLVFPPDVERLYGEPFSQGMKFVMLWEKEISIEHGEVVAIWGISSRWHREQFKKLSAMYGPARLREAINYYYQTFWVPVTELTPLSSERIFLFDTAVNQGLSVARTISSPPSLLSVLALRRIRWYSRERRAAAPHHLLRGWLNRVFALLDDLGRNY